MAGSTDAVLHAGAGRRSRILKDLRVGGYIKTVEDRMIIATKPPSAW